MNNNNQVQAFLNELLALDDDKYVIINQLREIVLQNIPHVNERMMYGGIMLSTKSADFGGLFVRKNHISFEFGNGYLLKDPQNLLEGKGKYRRHLKIRSLADIQEKRVDSFVKQLV